MDLPRFNDIIRPVVNCIKMMTFGILGGEFSYDDGSDTTRYRRSGVSYRKRHPLWNSVSLRLRRFEVKDKPDGSNLDVPQ